MSGVTRYQQYAADCLQQAQSEVTPDHKTITLTVALAWLRLKRADRTKLRRRRQANGPS